MKKSILTAVSILLIMNVSLLSQPAKIMNSSELKLALEKLNTLGSVLYIAAHPDDENTAVLSYFSTEKHLRTAYLSITRGDGGQNLIGKEQDDLLGIIRTQELLEARKTDGAEQFFTRAVDYGFTKSPGEALSFWGKEEILSDVVWVIRKFKPDIIVTRFPSTGEGGHGQHTASALLAEEAFNAAADPNKFPEQLEYVNVWQPKRLFWNAWLPVLENRGDNVEGLLKTDVGIYNPLLGKSYSEIAAESRTMHKSQGFGSSGRRGENINYFKLIAGDPAQNDLFEGIDLSWNRIEGGEKISSLLSEAELKFNLNNPSEILPVLLEAYTEMEKHKNNYWIDRKKKELLDVIRSASGLWIEAIANNHSFSPGNLVEVSAGIVNRSNFPLSLKAIKISYANNDSLFNESLNNGEFISHKFSFTLPEDINITQPYWLLQQKDKFRYKVGNQQWVGEPENKPAVTADFVLSDGVSEITFSTPVLYRWTDPVDGEKYRPVEIVPAVTIKLQDKIYLFPSNEQKNIIFSLRNNSDSFEGKVKINLPGNWNVAPPEIPLRFTEKEEAQVSFSVTPPAEPGEAHFTVEVISGNKSYDKEMVTISYPHIQTQTVFPVASGKLIRLETEKIIGNIGYVEGSGDDIPKYIEQLGYHVEALTDNQLENGLLKYDAIITGIRAYNVKERLKVQNKKLLDYVYNGGTLVVQYNTERSLVTKEIGPYPFQILRERVTNEESPVLLLKPEHKLLNYPNKITLKDFEGWVQERGLYFTGEADPRYEAILGINDTGENPLSGGLIFAHYGKGVFIYTSLSFFRQLPAGVPGAYRLFINLISAGKQSG